MSTTVERTKSGKGAVVYVHQPKEALAARQSLRRARLAQARKAAARSAVPAARRRAAR